MMRMLPWPGRATWRDQGGAVLVLVLLCGAHVWAICLAMGGWANLWSEWPLLHDDHGIHYSHAIVSRVFLRESGFSAGYDPSFMAGFPMSVIAGTSFTLVNVAMLLFSTVHPALVYKLTVWACVASVPFLMTWAGLALGLSLRGTAWSTLFYLLYFWTDFPVSYARFGMIAFMLAVPVGLVTLTQLIGFLEAGGWQRWLGAALACSVTFFVHLMSPMFLGVAGLIAYAHATVRARGGQQAFPLARHVAFWTLPLVILPLNAFWWLPGVWLRSTVGRTTLAFAHPESLFWRLGEIFWNDAVMQPILIGLGVIGLVLLASARPVAASALGGLVAAGFGWGYLAGPFRALDGLQPGRQTYACYSGLCLAAGYALGELSTWLRAARPGRFDRWLTVALGLIGFRIFAPMIHAQMIDLVLAPVPILSAEPHPALVRLVANIRRHLQPGERLLYEETGLAIPGLTSPFSERHFSPILPTMTGVEVLGGPYLHTPVTANFTQFGEGKLFGERNWNRADFVRYARIYRPSAIACWTPRARVFCRDNPDLVRPLAVDDDLFFGRVVGFEGATSRGQATVEATPNRLVVRDLKPDADGLVVLRYHVAPCLIADPPTPIEPITLEQDPVPFIGLRPTGPGPITLRMVLPPRGGWFAPP